MQTHAGPWAPIMKTRGHTDGVELTEAGIPHDPWSPHSHPPPLNYFYVRKGKLLPESGAPILEFVTRESAATVINWCREDAETEAPEGPGVCPGRGGEGDGPT